MIIGGRKAAGYFFYTPPLHTKTGTMRTFFVKISKKCLKNVVYVEFLW